VRLLAVLAVFQAGFHAHQGEPSVPSAIQSQNGGQAQGLGQAIESHASCQRQMHVFSALRSQGQSRPTCQFAVDIHDSISHTHSLENHNAGGILRVILSG
jgi:hypothetical protein